MLAPEFINVNYLTTVTKNAQWTWPNNIDKVSNLDGAKVYLFSGTEDTILVPGKRCNKKISNYNLLVYLKPESA